MNARHDDPQTSHDAAASMLDSIAPLEKLIYGVVKSAGAVGSTLDDVCKALDVDKVTISPRFRPMCRRGVLTETDATRMGGKGRNQTVWRVAA